MRDFEKEYKNYINEEVPDLWDRIESGLTEKVVSENGNAEAAKEDVKKNINQDIEQDAKKDRNESGQKKILYLMKRSMPAVAALCVLLIGFGAIRMSNRSNSAASVYEESTELTAEEPACEAAYEDYDETVAEEVADAAGDAEEYVTEAQETEEAVSYADEAPAENVRNEAATAGADTAADSAMADADVNKENALVQSTDGMITVAGAVLTGISMADADLQDEGFAYVYRFSLADGDKIEVYLTQSQCDELEKDGVEIKRQTTYNLDVKPYDDKTDFSKCILINIEENE